MNAPLRVRAKWTGARVVFGATTHLDGKRGSVEVVFRQQDADTKEAKRRVVGGVLCNAIYQIAHDWAFNRFVTEMAMITHEGGVTTVELCHTWRIVRPASGALAFLRWHPLQQVWQTVQACDLPVLPLISRNRGKLAQDLIAAACAWYAERAAESVRHAMSESAVCRAVWSSKLDEAQQFARDLLRQNRLRYKTKFETAASAGSVVGAALWQLIDRDLMSIVARIWLHPTIRSYADVVAHERGARRVNEEHRNLLPMLCRIPPERWDDSSLFAHYRWKDASSAPVPKSVIASRQAFRYLLAAPAPLHRVWLCRYEVSRYGALFGLAYEILARSRVPVQTLWKQRAVHAISLRLFSFRAVQATQSEADLNMAARLVDCFFERARELHATFGWRTALTELKPGMLADLIDWWVADGRARHLPDRQSTWTSINRAEAAWIQDQNKSPAHDATWASALGPVEIEGVEVIPLDSGAKLAEEGATMHHCVGIYASLCASDDGQRVFSLRLGEHRSTLRIERRENGWRIGEHSAQCNERPVVDLERIGPLVAQAYAVAERECQVVEQREPECEMRQ